MDLQILQFTKLICLLRECWARVCCCYGTVLYRYMLFVFLFFTPATISFLEILATLSNQMMFQKVKNHLNLNTTSSRTKDY